MKKALIVVDYQNDFIDGALGFPMADSIAPGIADKINLYLSENNDIIFTFDTHMTDYLDTQEGKKLPVPHCIYGTEGWELHKSITEFKSKAAASFMKNTFGSHELMNYLLTKNYESIELVGLVSNICVISNAVIAKTALPNAEITVDVSCTDSFDKELHNKALDVMEGLHINIINR